MAKYNVIFEWMGPEEHKKDFPNQYITRYDGDTFDTRTYAYMRDNNIQPRALNIKDALKIMEYVNNGRCWDLIGWRAIICNAIEILDNGKYTIMGASA